MNAFAQDLISAKQCPVCGRERQRVDSGCLAVRRGIQLCAKQDLVLSDARRSFAFDLCAFAESGGFTLLELLVVVALIASLVCGIGLALRQPGDSVSLQAAQTTFASLLGAARGRAALSQQDARCAVAADPADSVTYLRFVRVLEQDPSDSANWLAKEDGTFLPAGVYVVPPVGAAVPGNPAWSATRRSTALPSSVQTVTINGCPGASCYCVQFTPRGTTGGGYLLLTVGRCPTGSSLAAPILDNSDNVRGVLLRSTGALTLVNDAGALGP